MRGTCWIGFVSSRCGRQRHPVERVRTDLSLVATHHKHNNGGRLLASVSCHCIMGISCVAGLTRGAKYPLVDNTLCRTHMFMLLINSEPPTPPCGPGAGNNYSSLYLCWDRRTGHARVTGTNDSSASCLFVGQGDGPVAHQSVLHFGLWGSVRGHRGFRRIGLLLSSVDPAVIAVFPCGAMPIVAPSPVRLM